MSNYQQSPSPYGGEQQVFPPPTQPRWDTLPPQPPPKSGMSRGAKIMLVVIAVLGAIGLVNALLLGGGPKGSATPVATAPASTDAPDPTTDPAPEPTTDPTTEPEAPGEPEGTREAPGIVGLHTYVGTSLEDDGQLVAEPTSINWNANEIVADENMFNEEPEEGMKYILVSFDFSYTGPTSMDPYFEINVTALINGRAYEEAWEVIPNSAGDIGDLYDGGEASGDFVLMVPAEADAENTLIGVGSGWDEPIWFTDAR